MLHRFKAPLVVVTTFLTAGCACPTVRTVIPLSEAQPRDLGWMGSERELPLEECKRLCGSPGKLTGCRVHPMRSGEQPGNSGPTGRALVCDQISSCPGGRAPSEVDLSAPLRGPSHEAVFWAAVARMEAVSVGSFLRLARELAAHGAPVAMIHRAARAAEEERRHAQLTARLAAQLGAELPEVPEVSLEVRELDAVALENEVEGCVRERWSAAIVGHQAAGAPHLAPIARDEAEHARLSQQVSSWARSALGAAGARRLTSAGDEAREQLLAELAARGDAAFERGLGLPTAERAHDLALAVLRGRAGGARPSPWLAATGRLLDVGHVA